MAKKKKNNELSDEDIFYMTEGLTDDLINVKNEQLRDEFLQLKEDVGIGEDDDDTQLYRSFVGHKIAVLLNTVEHLIRENKRTNQMFVEVLGEVLGEIIDALNDKT